MTHPLAIAGAETAAAHADRVHASWSDRAYSFFERWASAQSEPFMMEDVRMAAEKSGSYVRPPDERAWGAILLRAKRAGRVAHAGYAPMKSPNCHGNPKSVWRWVA